MFRTQIYASPENFTPSLHVMHVTFRRSVSTDHLKPLLLFSCGELAGESRFLVLGLGQGKALSGIVFAKVT